MNKTKRLIRKTTMFGMDCYEYETIESEEEKMLKEQKAIMLDLLKKIEELTKIIKNGK